MKSNIPLLLSLWRQQWIRFLLAGGVAALTNWGSRWLFSSWVGYIPAIILAYLLGMLVAFFLMRTHVFTHRNDKGKLGRQILKFIGINLLALLQTLLISTLLARWALPHLGLLEQAEAVAHGVGVLVPVITSYFGHRWLTFR